jgi:hypothetical protein
VVVDLCDGIIGRQSDVGGAGERGERGKDFGLVGGDGGRDEGLRLGLLQAERVALPCLVALGLTVATRNIRRFSLIEVRSVEDGFSF